MKVSQQIELIEKQRGAAILGMEAIYARASEAGRVFDDAEQSAFDSSKEEIDKLDKQLDNLKSLESLMATKSAPIAAPAVGDGVVVASAASKPAIQVVRNLPAGSAFTRYAMALAASRGNLIQAQEIAKTHCKDTPEVEMVLRAAVAAGTTTDPQWAKPLVEYTTMADEFISLLRPATIIGRMTAVRRVPFNVRMPRQTAGASASWVGEAQPKPVSKLAFDTVLIPWSKIAVISVITDELARFSNPSAEALVRSDLIETIGTYMDVQLIDPSVAPVANISPGSITNGAQTVPSSGTTVADVTNDLAAAMQIMVGANLQMRSPVWVLHPRTRIALSLLRTNQDLFAFRDEMSRGTLLGIPFVESANVPVVGTATTITLVDQAEIFYADDGGVTLDVSTQASLQMNDAPAGGAAQLVSMFQNNMVALRAERYVYWLRRRDEAVVVITGVEY
jgi:HK97 family phage major capsid protein